MLASMLSTLFDDGVKAELRF